MKGCKCLPWNGISTSNFGAVSRCRKQNMKVKCDHYSCICVPFFRYVDLFVGAPYRLRTDRSFAVRIRWCSHVAKEARAWNKNVSIGGIEAGSWRFRSADSLITCLGLWRDFHGQTFKLCRLTTRLGHLKRYFSWERSEISMLKGSTVEKET